MSQLAGSEGEEHIRENEELQETANSEKNHAIKSNENHTDDTDDTECSSTVPDIEPTEQDGRRNPEERTGGTSPKEYHPTKNSLMIDDSALCNLIVNYLPPLMNEVTAFQLFSQFGPINSVKIIYDKESGESRGYGFIRYECFFSATYAISCLNRYEIAGKKLKVAYANLPAARKALNYRKECDSSAVGFSEHQKLVFHTLHYQQLELEACNE